MAEKKTPKGDLKLSVSLNDEQKKVVADFYNNDVNIITSDFGCGKTMLTTYTALQCLQKRMFDKIIFTRPVVKSRQDVLGFLPGSMEEKLAPFVDHIKYLLNQIYKPERITKYIEEGKIVFLPLELTKGYNFDSTLLVVDEFEDCSFSEFRNILTRVGKTSKVILAGSEEQIDDSMKNSCMHVLNKVKDKFPSGIVWNKLTINHRNEKMYQFIKMLDQVK
jgi:phosphate starvation-inducible protein PhoH and related proteins